MHSSCCERHTAIGRVACQVGAQVKKEEDGLDPHSNQRPDLEIVFPGRIRARWLVHI